MSRIRYLLDEDVPRAIRDQLLGRVPDMDILAVGDASAPAKSTPDQAILEWVERTGYVLVSRNRRTMPRHLQEHWVSDRHIPGLFLLRRRCSIGQVIEELVLIWEASDAEEYQDKIEYLPF